MPHRITSRHVSSHHISYYIILCHFTSRHVTSRLITSHHISYHILSYYIILYYIFIFYIISSYYAKRRASCRCPVYSRTVCLVRTSKRIRTELVYKIRFCSVSGVVVETAINGTTNRNQNLIRFFPQLLTSAASGLSKNRTKNLKISARRSVTCTFIIRSVYVTILSERGGGFEYMTTYSLHGAESFLRS